MRTFTISTNIPDDDEEILTFAQIALRAVGPALDNWSFNALAVVLSQCGSKRWATEMLAQLVAIERVVADNDIDNALEFYDRVESTPRYPDFLAAMEKEGFGTWAVKWSIQEKIRGMK